MLAFVTVKAACAFRFASSFAVVLGVVIENVAIPGLGNRQLRDLAYGDGGGELRKIGGKKTRFNRWNPTGYVRLEAE
jgi:hypothetical protein